MTVSDIIIEYIARCAEGLCLFLLFKTFGKQKLKDGVTSCIITVLMWVVLSKEVSILVYPVSSVSFPVTLERSVLSMLLRACLMFLLGYFMFKIDRNVLFFMVLTFISFTYISVRISQGICSLFINTIDWMAMKFDVMNSIALIKGLLKFISIFRDSLIVILEIISTKIVIKNCKHDLNNKDTKELVSYMFPVIMGSLASVLLHFIIVVINDLGELDNINYRTFNYVYFAITIVYIAIWVAMLISFKIQQEIIGLHEEQMQKSIYENQILQMQNSMTEMEIFYDGIRQVKHDMKNQMAVMEDMLKEQKCGSKEVAGYFDGMQETIDRLEQKIHTGNAVSDAVINAKFGFAEKEMPGIKLNADEFILPEKINIKPYDIGIILNNGLDNAIEACSRMRKYAGMDEPGNIDNIKDMDNQDNQDEVYITIRSFWKKSMFFIEIENSFNGDIIWGDENIPVTTKPDSRLHGIGLKNIRTCAKKYMGDIECSTKDGIFVLSVMLKA